MRGALSLLLGAVSVSAIRDPTDKPNIVMFFVDDLGYGDMGFTGHPSTKTPNFDKMAYNGKVLSSWYSGCSVCSGSRSALMTGRQYVRLGVPGVFFPTVADGLNLNETIVGKQLKKAGYKTAAMGKWHLGQRNVYLPGSRGFDRYLGIPYSDDMGKATTSSCNAEDTHVNVLGKSIADGENTWDQYVEAGHARKGELSSDLNDPAAAFLPLVHQIDGNTTVLEQPLDFTTLAIKYNAYVLDVIEDFQADPFFLYMPFSHVHTTATNQPEAQYAGCAFKNYTTRGMFGDALAEADWIAGNVLAKLEQLQLEKNTLILFTSDNGPWMVRGKSGGSVGIHYGRASGYWNVGKGSTWEGGIHMPAFAYWPDMIEAGTRTTEVVSSLDLFPTASALAGVDLPENVFYDGRDMTDVLLKQDGKSKHEFLFFYNSGGEAKCGGMGPTAVRYGRYKAHFETGPGMFGCIGCKTQCYDPMLLFDVLEDPSEAYPLALNSTPAAYANVINEIIAARDAEAKTMYYGKLTAAPDGPGEGPGTYGVCCDRTLGCNCTTSPSKW